MDEVVVVSSDDGTKVEETAEGKKKRRDKEAPSSEVVRWEKYLPKMVLRVLLVEADDSTRRIIAALLRKCSYSVTAVADGLTAWETLKGRPENIDLILTELDLPSISGFALLSLVMEHETCKNIPIITMSTENSISMVRKCMLRGAADYLVKPVRKNELRNLWQHIWRRHALRYGPVVHSLPASHPKLEASAENNADSKVYSTETHENTNDKGIDALVQSSPSSHFKEAEDAYVEKLQGISQLKHENGGLSYGCPGKLMENVKSSKESAFWDQIEEKLDGVGETGGGGQMPIDSYRCVRSFSNRKFESSIVTMDLIGVFDRHPDCPLHRVDCSNANLDPELELSLKRFCPGSSLTRDDTERQDLCHSNVSAFSPYGNGKPLQHAVDAAVVVSHEPERLSEWREQFKRVNCDMQSATTSSNQENVASCISISGQSGQVEFSSQHRVLEPMFFPNSHLSQPVPTTNQVQQTSVTDPELCESEETINCSADPNKQKVSKEQENECGCQSTCTNSYNGGIARHSDSTAHGATFPEKLNEEQNINVLPNEGLSSQREAALEKFRLKRKDRCFEKKVRYQSRKKLAEGRPRVKGQFVRTVHRETVAPDASNGA